MQTYTDTYVSVVYGWVQIQQWTPQRRMLKRDWIMNSKIVNCSRCNNQNIRVFYMMHLITHKILTLVMNRTCPQASKSIRKVATSVI